MFRLAFDTDSEDPNPYHLWTLDGPLYETDTAAKLAGFELEAEERLDYGAPISSWVVVEDNKLAEAVRKIKEAIEDAYRQQLACYCQFLDFFQDQATPGRMVTAWGRRIYLRGKDPYTLCLGTSTEELERLREEDPDSAWDSFDSEQHEGYDALEGEIGGLQTALGLLTGSAA